MSTARASLAFAIGLLLATPAIAQHAGHTMPMDMPGMVMPPPKPAAKTAAPAPKRKATVPKPAVTPVHRKRAAAPVHTAMDMGAMDMAGMDMSSMPGMHGRAPKKAAARTAPARAGRASRAAQQQHASHAMPGMDVSKKPRPAAVMKHPAASTHDMSSMPGMDMPGMHHDAHAPTPASAHLMPGMDMSGANHDAMDMSAVRAMDMPGMHHGGTDLPAAAAPRTPVPAITDADRAAAFPELHSGHAAHDRHTHSYVLVDRLESHDSDSSGAWETRAWIGGDIDRAWLRSEGEVAHGRVADGDIELLYGHAIGPWWEVVAGIRRDDGDGPSRTAAAFGVQGLAPYKFDVEATAYLDTHGRVSARLQGEYDTLLTNRLILQWRGEADLYGTRDAARRAGAGLATVTAGARLRYEITRRFAPYAGIEVERAFGSTAGMRRADGVDITDTRAVAGLRFWF